MNLNDLETFVLVAEVGTFTGAAEDLGVPKSTVSRRVARLEDDLGIALLNRSGRSISLTDDGRALAQRCASPLREISRVERGLGDTEVAPRGELRVTAPIDIGSSRLVTDVIAEYAKTYPNVDLTFEVTNRFIDLLEEGFDVAFRGHSGPLKPTDDLVIRSITPISFGLYASPEYLESAPKLERFEDLSAHRIVAHSEANREVWPVEPAVEVNDYAPLVALVESGAGVGGLPSFLAQPSVDQGTLVETQFEWDVEPARLSLVWLRSRHLAPRVRAFIDMAVEKNLNFGK